MTTEQVKKRLNQYHHIQMERRQLADKIRRLEARLTSAGGCGMDGMPHGSGSGDAMARGVAALADLRSLYQSKADELIEAQAHIERLIGGLEPVERLIARYRYIDGMQWEQICVKVCYSWRQTHRIHADMIEKLAERFTEAERTVRLSLEDIARAAERVSPLKLGRMQGRADLGLRTAFAEIDETHTLREGAE